MKQQNEVKRASRSLLHDKLMDQVILALAATGKCKVWQQQTGAAYRNGKMIRYGLKGSADITGILIDGRRLEVEIKTGAAEQHGSQPAFEAMIRKMNGVYFVARSVEDALQKLNQAFTN